nr:MAG TPA: hypothetical protein [Caudoviricetes sp.]
MNIPPSTIFDIYIILKKYAKKFPIYGIYN